MKNLFDKESYNEIVTRLDGLTAQSQRQWGKMDVAQMLAHAREVFKIPLRDKKIPRAFMGLIFGWMIKKKLYDGSPWKQNLPTSPDFIIKGAKDFDTEKAGLKELVIKFHQAGPNGISKYPHPFFGKFTPEQWGQSMYKHLDHHLKQFGA